MTGEKIRTSRKDHNKPPNKNDDIMDTHEDPSNGTVHSNVGSNAFLKTNKAFQQSQLSNVNANNLNANASIGHHTTTTTGVVDDNKNPVILEGLEFPVHECVFGADVRRLSSLIRVHSIAQKDVHGNTPLHLAVMLGHKECALLLLAHNAPVKIKNALGWSPLAEAISYGDRQMITAILRKLKQQSRESVEDKRPKLLNALRELGDFYLELHWDFQSWVPLLSRILPSDACKIYKQGNNIRLDTTLIDFTDMKCQRGDLSFIFTGDAAPSQSFVVLDNEAKVYQRIHHEESEMETEEEVDILMSSDVYSATLSTKSITFARSQIGWLFREDKTEKVGNFLADFYAVNGLPTRRQSLTAPAPNTISWEEYITAEHGKPPHLGRELVCKESKKNFKATVAMSQDFPLGIESLLNVLEVIAPFKHFNKLREFVQMKLPPGFPVKLVSLKSPIFAIPAEYKEDPCRFPDL
ncbi:hypothetical protein CRUP_031838 [Coryphaenoides rupestris]|nr:hypothetical protein CRUP_031838 [Coryphaenoides rupestris]